MSEIPVAPAKVPGFADALTRAKEIASKIRPGEDKHFAGSKRPFEDTFSGPESKRPSSDFEQNMSSPDIGGGAPPSEVIMVPDKMVSFIIGRGGETITRLQGETGCKIQMAGDSQGLPERRCTLTGNPQAIANAKNAISRLISSEGSNKFSSPTMGMNGGSERFELMVPGHKVGMIIGKGGENIRNMQESTGAKIVIIQETAEFADEKPLIITGSQSSIERAKSMVYDILSQEDDNSSMMSHDGGRGRGRGRGMPMRGGPPFGSRGRGGFDRGGGHGAPWQGHGGPGGHEVPGFQDFVRIPSNKCGLVIGKGGETIIGINRASGAHCEIDKQAPPDALDKNFSIRGTREAVEKAKQMILEKAGLGPPGSSNGSWGGQYPTHGGHKPDQGAYINPPAGQADYSAQWIDYYRKMGMTREAEAIERNSASRAPAADYSAQWAEYYRSIGKHEEAAAIEAQMKPAQAAPAYPAAGNQYPGAYYGGAPPAQPGMNYSAHPGYMGYQQSNS